MSKRRSLKEIMTAAGLAQGDLQRERLKGQRSANNVQGIAGALSSLTQVGTQAIPAAYAHAGRGMAEDAMNPHLSAVPEEGEDAATASQRLLGDSFKEDPNADPLQRVANLIGRPARGMAQRQAQSGLTDRIQGNQERQRQMGRQDAQDQRAAGRDQRAQERFQREERGHTRAQLQPVTQTHAREGFAASQPGDMVGGMPLGEGETGEEAALAGMVQQYEARGFDPETARSYALDDLRQGRQALTTEQRAGDLHGRKVALLDRQADATGALAEQRRRAPRKAFGSGRGQGGGAAAGPIERQEGQALIDSSKGSKPLESTALQQVGGYELAGLYAKRTKDFYNENIKGSGIAPKGRLGSWVNEALGQSGLAPEWNELQRKNKITVQLLGRASEGGKLTDNDFDRYLDIFGDPSKTTPAEFERALDDVESLSNDLYNSSLLSFAKGGRDVSGFELRESAPQPRPAAPERAPAPSARRPMPPEFDAAARSYAQALAGAQGLTDEQRSDLYRSWVRAQKGGG